jgi:hypothetical protein
VVRNLKAGLEPASPACAGALSLLSYFRVLFRFGAIIHNERPIVKCSRRQDAGGVLVGHAGEHLVDKLLLKIRPFFERKKIARWNSLSSSSGFEIIVPGRQKLPIGKCPACGSAYLFRHPSRIFFLKSLTFRCQRDLQGVFTR